jgi:hypothetical protein
MGNSCIRVQGIFNAKRKGGRRGQCLSFFNCAPPVYEPELKKMGSISHPRLPSFL